MCTRPYIPGTSVVVHMDAHILPVHMVAHIPVRMDMEKVNAHGCTHGHGKCPIRVYLFPRSKPITSNLISWIPKKKILVSRASAFDRV